jgi:hypothetical protein
VSEDEIKWRECLKNVIGLWVEALGKQELQADRNWNMLSKVGRLWKKSMDEADRLRAEVDRLRAIEAAAKTWSEWGGHCPLCAFVRHREGNPLLSIELLWDYCDCGWHAAQAALAAKGEA